MVKDDLLTCARVSNTLAQNTGKIRLTACVDWVSCSFQSRSTFEQIFNLIGISDLGTLEEIRGARYEFAGYDKTYRLGKIELMHYQDEDQNDHWLLNMSGQGCRQFEISSTFDFPTLFAILANVHAVYTRLDIAIDDVTNIFTVNKFRNAVYNKQCVTRLRDWGDHRRGKIATGLDDVCMNNFYLGSSSSRYFINVYDKKLERESKGFEVEHKTWVRTEVRFRYEYADKFIIHLINNRDGDISYHIRSFLNNNIVFLKPSALSKDTNRSRLAKDIKNHAEWWRSFLHNCGYLKLTTKRPDKTLDQSKEWIYKQVATTLAMLYEYNEAGFNAFIDVVIAKGLNNMTKQHERKVENQRYLDRQIVSFGDWQEKEDKYNRRVNSKRVNKKMLLDQFWNMIEEQEKKSVSTGIIETDSFTQ